MPNTTKTILITGATSGIGEALAKLYASNHARLLLIGRNVERLNSVAAACKKQGATVITATIDVREKQTLHDWIVQNDSEQSIDLVIANAGIAKTQARREVKDAMEVDQMIFDVNLQGVLNTIHPIITAMQKRKSGQIAVVSSLAAFINGTSFAAYSASKAAVKTYSLALRTFLKADKIKVNTICPGYVVTPLIKGKEFTPFFPMNVEKAAKIIKRGLNRNKTLIAFPRMTYWSCRLYLMLPVWLQERLSKTI